jgi:hypothetical protein
MPYVVYVNKVKNPDLVHTYVVWEYRFYVRIIDTIIPHIHTNDAYYNVTPTWGR